MIKGADKCLYLCTQFDLTDSSCLLYYVWFKRGLGVMVFNATFNNISVISWLSVLLVEKTGVPGENHLPAESHWQRNCTRLFLWYKYLFYLCVSNINNILVVVILIGEMYYSEKATDMTQSIDKQLLYKSVIPLPLSHSWSRYEQT
jgi:hypothetical protein